MNNIQDKIGAIGVLFNLMSGLTDKEILEGKSYKSKLYTYSFLISVWAVLLVVSSYLLVFMQNSGNSTDVIIVRVIMGLTIVGWSIILVIPLFAEGKLEGRIGMSYKKFKKLAKKDSKELFKRVKNHKTFNIYLLLLTIGSFVIGISYALSYSSILSGLNILIMSTVAYSVFIYVVSVMLLENELNVSIEIMGSSKGISIGDFITYFFSEKLGMIYMSNEGYYYVFDKNSLKWVCVKIVRKDFSSSLAKIFNDTFKKEVIS